MLHLLQPYWLTAMLPALGVVLWLHRRKTRTLPLVHFGAMRFIQQVLSPSTDRSKLEHLLLLVLRMLILGMLLTAFASPVWQQPLGDMQQTTVAIVLDGTASMSREVDHISDWQSACQGAIDLLGKMMHQPVMIYILTDHLRPLLDEPSRNYAHLAGKIQRNGYALMHGTFTELASQPQWDTINEVHLFTDGQANQFPTLQAWQTLLGDRTCVIHILASKQRHNIAVTDIQWLDASTPTQRAGQLRFTLNTDAKTPITTKLNISVNTKVIQQRSVTHKPMMQTIVTQPLNLQGGDAIALGVTLAESDAIAWDDSLSLILPAWSLLSVRAYDDAELTNQIAALFTTLGYDSKLGLNPAECLLIVSDAVTDTLPAIAKHLDGGGTVLWLLTNEQQSKVFGEFAKAHTPDLIPGHWETRQTLLPAYWQWAWDDPWLDLFAGPYASALGKIASSKLLVWEGKPTAWRVFAANGGEPVIVSTTVGTGRLMVMAIDATQLQNLRKDPAMLSLILHLGHQAALAGVDHHPESPKAIGYRWLPSVNDVKPVWVRPPVGFDYPFAKGDLITLDQPGLYQLRHHDDDQIAAMISCRVDPLESDNTQINSTDYAQLGKANDQLAVKQQGHLWPSLLVMAMFFAVLESVIVHELRAKGERHGA
jgi:hypothetical protein